MGERAVTSGKGSYPPPFSGRFFAPRYWPTWLGLGLLGLLALLPGGVRRRLGGAVGALAYRYHHKRRAIVATNLEWCFPELDGTAREALARDYFRLMAQSFFDYGVLWWASRRRLDKMLKLEGAEYLQAQVDAGRPVILLTSHTIGLDFGAAALTRHFPSVGLVKRARNPLFDWYMARGRTRFQGILYRREEGMRPVIRAIKQGHAFYYLPDEDLGPENSIFVPFFGVPTATIDALSRLARMSGAAVLPFATVYRPEEGDYVARIGEPLADFPSEKSEADTARMNRELEWMIREAPAQYMWSMRLFQTRPDGSPPPYAMKGKPGSGHRERPDSA
ncbi:MAG: lysophospholipid acyltransferase family protein [Gammaproteobacteria bacterium]|nr:lysophospholipid acyltransferase family protein [Gammaproteobacteria bacterium]